MVYWGFYRDNGKENQNYLVMNDKKHMDLEIQGRLGCTRDARSFARLGYDPILSSPL